MIEYMELSADASDDGALFDWQPQKVRAAAAASAHGARGGEVPGMRGMRLRLCLPDSRECRLPCECKRGHPIVGRPL